LVQLSSQLLATVVRTSSSLSTPLPRLIQLFFLHNSADHPDLHSFPTRRSSDLLIELGPERLSKDRLIEFMDRPRPVHEFNQAILDRKSTRLNSSHSQISYAVFCLKKKKKQISLKVSIYNQHFSMFFRQLFFRKL